MSRCCNSIDGRTVAVTPGIVTGEETVLTAIRLLDTYAADVY
jgi:hypothetical protein